jgi:glycosyltransferase involved in cell wall biosynthesis
VKLLFCIHTPKNKNTAVYGAYLNKKIYCEERGWTADILTPQDFPHSKLTGRRVYLFYPLHLALRLLQNKGNYDIIIFHSYCGWVFNLFRLFFPQLRRATVITTFHGLEPLFIQEMIKEHEAAEKPLNWYFKAYHGWFLNQLIRFSCRRSDALFCLNSRERDYLIQSHYQKAEKIFINSNDARPMFLVPRPYAPKATRLLFVGQWLITKGTRYLVQAYEKLAAQDPDYHLVIVGAFKTKDDVQKDIPAHLMDRISVYPQIDHDHVISYYQQADLFLFPSLSEGFSRALIEAMMTGLPVISTTAGSGIDFLKHEENAWIIPFSDADAIADAVSKLKDNRVLRQKLGTAAQQIAAEQFLSENAIASWAKICLKVHQQSLH